LVERIVQDTITARGPDNQPEGPAVLTETLRLTGVSSTP
jgi:O-acetyl-ADP-ribose deacetylase (regulator of RNase III)